MRVNALCNCFRAQKKQNPLCVAVALLGLRCVGNLVMQGKRLMQLFEGPKINKVPCVCLACALLGLRCVGLAFCVENRVIEGKSPMQLF